MNYISPINDYDQVNLLLKSNKVQKEGADDAFMKMVIEQIFLSKVFNTSSFLEEDDEQKGEISFKRNDVAFMDEHVKKMVINELNDNDAFGLLGAIKNGK